MAAADPAINSINQAGSYEEKEGDKQLEPAAQKKNWFGF
jgi:hypothetical protein